jgi:hypothetical protein
MSDFEQKVLFHLTVILYPPVSKLLLRPALIAIDLAKSNRMSVLVPMPGKKYLSVRKLIDALHLHGFVHPVEANGHLEVVQKRAQEPVVQCYVAGKLKKTLSFLLLMIR